MGLVIDRSDGGTIASMRLVSKAWLAAVREHPIIPKHKAVTRADDLKKLCAIMPNMRGVELSSAARRINLSPLSALSTLEHVSLAGTASPHGLAGAIELCASLRALPSSLRSLQLQYVSFCPKYIRSLKFVSLRFLSFRFWAFSQPAVWDMLPYLPQLEVRFADVCPESMILGLH